MISERLMENGWILEKMNDVKKSKSTEKSRKFIAIRVMLIIAMIIIGYSLFQIMNSPFSKTNVCIVVDDYKYDAHELSKFTRWHSDPRNEMCEYMQKNNLVIKPGKYFIRDGASFKEALDVFEFLLIVEGNEYDFEKVNTFRTWINYFTRKRLVRYMKRNNLIIKPGTYEIKYKAAYDEVLEIFDFVKIE